MHFSPMLDQRIHLGKNEFLKERDLPTLFQPERLLLSRAMNLSSLMQLADQG